MGGYVGIFMAHLPKRSFFGYDFLNHQWTVPARIIHGWLGYAVLTLCIAQASMGIAKMAALNESKTRIFTFHGTLGKAIITMGATNIVIACYFWAWSTPMKSAIATLTVCAGLLGTF